MPPRSKLFIAKPDIVRAFDLAERRVWTVEQISELMDKERELGRLPKSQPLSSFIQFLVKHTELRVATFQFPGRKFTRYLWGDSSIFELASSARPGAYLSHYSAVYLHNLSEQTPRTIYVTREQPYESKGSELIQERIDNAFQRSVRVSNEVATFGDYRICVVHGPKTNALGIMEIQGPDRETLKVTGIERTLIDIAVRPVYAGGAFEVLKSYKLASETNISVNKLAAMLQQLGHACPYHQVIGFYLERSGEYSESQISLLRKFPIRFDFYLEHGMESPQYSKDWRLFYPKGM